MPSVLPPLPAISVAMATCNGAAHLREQLDSLLNQTLIPAEIIITDDASTDATAQIIADFADTSPIPVHFHHNPTRLGVIQNFARAISLCQCPYIALADQDDVWLPNRLAATAIALHALEKKYGASTPLLVHTDLTITDATLTPTHPSLLARNAVPRWLRRCLPTFTLILSNPVTGNTVLFNRALAARALPIPPVALMHDHWLTLIASHHGQVQTLPLATVLYRQHGKNQVGAGHRAPAPIRLFRSFRAKFLQAGLARARCS